METEARELLTDFLDDLLRQWDRYFIVYLILFAVVMIINLSVCVRKDPPRFDTRIQLLESFLLIFAMWVMWLVHVLVADRAGDYFYSAVTHMNTAFTVITLTATFSWPIAVIVRVVRTWRARRRQKE